MVNTTIYVPLYRYIAHNTNVDIQNPQNQDGPHALSALRPKNSDYPLQTVLHLVKTSMKCYRSCMDVRFGSSVRTDVTVEPNKWASFKDKRDYVPEVYHWMF